MMFFVGLHQASDAQHIDAAFMSRNRLRTRRKPLGCRQWIMDSGAFSLISKHGGYPEPVSAYAEIIKRWAHDLTLLAAVSEDYMCEPHMLERTGMTIAEHQRLSVQRYDEILAENTGVLIIPVLQGYSPESYADHVRMYGERLGHEQWVGVGSVCKRNGDPRAIELVLLTIKKERPDLRLHGFGLKATAFRSPLVVSLLHSADSMAWSFAARKQGRNANDWREAKRFAERINTQPKQMVMGF